MQNYNTKNSSTTIISCIKCFSKLRVPADRGKISVICPICRDNFIYNPDSILTTLKQVGLLILSRLPKNKFIRQALIVAGLAILAILLYYVFSTSGNSPSPKTGGLLKS
jgi:hypothetical protein